MAKTSKKKPAGSAPQAPQQQSQQATGPTPAEIELQRKRSAIVYTNINAVAIGFTYEDGSKEGKYYFAKQDKPQDSGVGDVFTTDAIPIRVDTFFVSDDKTDSNVNNVTLTGFAKIQAPSIKSIPRSDTTSKAVVELKNPSSVSVYFGFANLAGIAGYNIYEKDTGKFLVQSGEIDLNSSSDVLVSTRGVELADNFDSTKNYILEIYHTGKVTNDLLLDHKIYVGDIKIHRMSDSTNSVAELISNDAFINNSFPDDGSRNSLTGRKNYVEFFESQLEVCDGQKSSFYIKGNAMKILKVELNNGRTFKELNQFVDWNVVNDAKLNMSVDLTFIPKQNSKLRITYEVASSFLQRQIVLTQPITTDGKYDRYTNIYVQNEAAYLSIQSKID